MSNPDTIMDLPHVKRRIRRARARGMTPNRVDLAYLKQESPSRESQESQESRPGPGPEQSTIPRPLRPPLPPGPNINQIPYDGGQALNVSQTLAGDSRPKGVHGRDWQDFTAKRLGPLIIVILYFALGDMEKAEFYAPTPQECTDLAPHVARLLPKIEAWLHAPEWVHEMLVTSDNSVALIALVAGYLDRTGLAERMIPQVIHVFSAKRNRNNGKTSPINQALRTNTGNGTGPGPISRGELTPIDLASVNIAGIGRQYE